MTISVVHTAYVNYTYQEWNLKSLKCLEDNNWRIRNIHTAPIPHTTIHHFGLEICRFLFQCGVLRHVGNEHCGICDIVLSTQLWYISREFAYIELTFLLWLWYEASIVLSQLWLSNSPTYVPRHIIAPINSDLFAWINRKWCLTITMKCICYQS